MDKHTFTPSPTVFAVLPEIVIKSHASSACEGRWSSKPSYFRSPRIKFFKYFREVEEHECFGTAKHLTDTVDHTSQISVFPCWRRHAAISSPLRLALGVLATIDRFWSLSPLQLDERFNGTIRPAGLWLESMKRGCSVSLSPPSSLVKPLF